MTATRSRDTADDCQIVRDEQIGDPPLALQIAEQVENPGAHRNVKRRQRFVQHDQLRLRCNGARDRDALPLAAGNFVNMPCPQVSRQADTFKQGVDRRRPACPIRDGMDTQRIVKHALDRRARVEGGKRVLEHHLQPSPRLSQARTAQRQQVLVREPQAPGVGIDKAHDHAGDRGFAAARGADKRKRLAMGQFEIDAVKRGKAVSRSLEGLPQAGRREQDVGHRAADTRGAEVPSSTA